MNKLLDSRTALVRIAAIAALVLGPVSSACEDEVVQGSGTKPSASKGPGSSKGGGKKKAPGRRSKSGPSGSGASAGDPAFDGNKGGVVLDGLTRENFNKTEDEVAPPPDPESVEGWLRIDDPAALARLGAPLLGELDGSAAVSALVESLYGIDGFEQFDLDGPAGVFWIAGFDAPALVLETADETEIVAQLSDAVKDRQGNALSVSVSVTRQAYVNFGDGYVVLTGDWQQYPLAGPTIDERMTGEPEGDDAGGLPLVAHGSFGKEVWARYERTVERLAKPKRGPLAGVWKDVRTDLGVLVGTAGETEIRIGSDGSRHRLELSVKPATDVGGLASWLEAERASPEALVQRVPAGAVDAPVRTIVFQDIAHDPVETTALAVMASSPFSPASDGELEAAEVARAETLGATLSLTSGFMEKEKTVSFAQIRDRDGFEAAHAALGARLQSAEGIEVLEPVEALAGARPFTYALSETRTVNGVEIARADEPELLALTIRSDDLVLDPAAVGAEVPKMLTEALAVVGPGTVIALVAMDFATTESETGTPFVAALTATEDALVAVVEVPQAQVLRLK